MRVFFFDNVVALCYNNAMKTQVNIRMEEELKEDLEQMAREEGRSLNNMIVHLLKCAVVNGGILRRAKVKRFDPNTDIMLMGKEKEDGR